MKGELQDEDIRIIIVYIFIFIVIILLPTGLARRYVDSRDLALPLQQRGLGAELDMCIVCMYVCMYVCVYVCVCE
jgi:hypothetical protein